LADAGISNEPKFADVPTIEKGQGYTTAQPCSSQNDAPLREVSKGLQPGSARCTIQKTGPHH